MKSVPTWGGVTPPQGSHTFCLLTNAGWLPARYEFTWSHGDGLRPYFHFVIAGVYDDVAIRIPPGARLAWPEELAASAARG